MASERQIHVGPVAIGGGAPVAVQTMTKTETANLAATMEQIRTVADAGAQAPPQADDSQPHVVLVLDLPNRASTQRV